MSETDVGLSELPDGWMWLTVGSAITKVHLTGKKLKQKNYERAGKLPVIDQGLSFIGGYTNDEELKVECQLPVVIFGDHTKVFKYVDFDFVAGADGIKVIRPQEMYYPKLFYYFAQATSLPEKGYARHFQFLEKAQIPLPPLPEQHRIVAKIEERFTKLDAGIDALHKVQAQLKRYRQSVLKAAFEGKLTEAWRAEHQDEIKPASVLLERVLKERRRKWAAEQLEQMKAKGKEPKDEKWKAKYKEPAAPDTNGLIELPTGWKWVKLEQVTYLVTKGSSPRWQGFHYVDDGIAFLRSQNVGWGMLDLSNIAYLPETFNEKEKKSILREGDVLLNIVGASIGRVAIASDELEGANMNQAVSLIRLVKDGLDNRLLMNYLISPDAQSTIHGKKVDVARANLSLTDVSEFATPLPPLLEQQAIVSEVERCLSVADEVEKTVTTELKRAEQLRQSILKQAFSGGLVPQDPNDEPASVLLERIREEKS